jgi:hypothetical protein
MIINTPDPKNIFTNMFESERDWDWDWEQEQEQEQEQEYG